MVNSATTVRQLHLQANKSQQKEIKLKSTQDTCDKNIRLDSSSDFLTFRGNSSVKSALKCAFSRTECEETERMHGLLISCE